jgi:hypothetical protein
VYPQVPLPWERLLWSSRPWRPASRLAGERYLLTDFRLVRIVRGEVEELALDEVGEIHRSESFVDRVFGTSTITIHRRLDADAPLVLGGVRRGAQLAALLELLASDPHAPREAGAVRSALAWEPRPPAFDLRQALAGFFGVLIAIFAVAIGLHGKTTTAPFASDDAIAPNGQKRSVPEIVAFMEAEVMPWARDTLGRLKGGPDRVTCHTCHGPEAEARGWRMPAVSALPQPDVREAGWEIYSVDLDAQLRNAIYGYLAGSEHQAKAGYMRQVVMPGMARLLHRPAYDFTRPYEYNRSRRALGCYHCHRVK